MARLWRWGALRKQDIALFALRMSGLLLAGLHGAAKVYRLSTGQGDGFVAGVAELGFPLPALFAWLAALAEFAGGLFVAVGLATRAAAVFAAATMCVAAFVRHQAHIHFLDWLGVIHRTPAELDELGNPELALVYLLIFFAIALLGPGRMSVDQAARRARS